MGRRAGSTGNVANQLAQRFTVYVCDLLGYRNSEKREGQDVSLAAQTQTLVELLELWEPDEPSIAGHDIGEAITLRLILLENRRLRRVALCDAVAIAPWITPFSRHVQRDLEALQTVPEHIHRQSRSRETGVTVCARFNGRMRSSWTTRWGHR
jgi:pimeloyl-ACP methyl ester carboxylesterase